MLKGGYGKLPHFGGKKAIAIEKDLLRRTSPIGSGEPPALAPLFLTMKMAV